MCTRSPFGFHQKTRLRCSLRKRHFVGFVVTKMQHRTMSSQCCLRVRPLPMRHTCLSTSRAALVVLLALNRTASGPIGLLRTSAACLRPVRRTTGLAVSLSSIEEDFIVRPQMVQCLCHTALHLWMPTQTRPMRRSSCTTWAYNRQNGAAGSRSFSFWHIL